MLKEAIGHVFWEIHQNGTTNAKAHLRTMYEKYPQLKGRAGNRQLTDPKIGLTHNLGGVPHSNAAGVSIVGKYR